MPSRKRPTRSVIQKLTSKNIKNPWTWARQNNTHPLALAATPTRDPKVDSELSKRANSAFAPIYLRGARGINLIPRFEIYFRSARASHVLPFPNMTGPFPYIGGKHRVAQKIISIFPADHTTYIEPFAGGAQLLFHKKPSPVEILNDLAAEIVNFFRVCQSHHDELLRTLKFTVASRKWFSLYRTQDLATLTDVQRAARFFYLQKNSYGGLIVSQNYHYCVAQRSNLNPDALPRLIENVHNRLARVQIECLPYEQILERYDRPTSLFYLDPPYWNRKLYRFNFTTADFVRLEERLRNLRGKFVLSLNDVPEVRQLFKHYVVQGIEFAYSAQRTAGKRYRELLIANFPFKLKPPQELAPEPKGPTKTVNS